MNIRRILLVACAGAVVVVVALAVSGYWEHKQTPFQNATKLISALQAFSRDQTTGGRHLPTEVSLQDLLRGGYLTTNDARAFEGMEVRFSTQADDTHPQMILARARTPDGQFICLLADGSVQQFTASRLREALENSGQPDGAPNRSQRFAPRQINHQRRLAPVADLCVGRKPGFRRHTARQCNRRKENRMPKSAIKLAAKFLKDAEDCLDALKIHDFPDDESAHDDELTDHLHTKFSGEVDRIQAELSKQYGPPSRTGKKDDKDIPANGVFRFAVWKVGKKQLFVAAHHEDRGVPIVLILGTVAQ
jgi:hypothetical protein